MTETPTLLIFGLGYSAKHIARLARTRGWDVMATGRDGGIDFADTASVLLALDRASHILSSVPPMADGDPVLNAYGAQLQRHRGSLAYLSSTGVYGDVGGAWVDEAAPIKGRRAGRNHADRDWLELGARVFRLPGIYGPGRSARDRVASGAAHRIDLPDQIFSRIHVDDIATGVMAGFAAEPSAYNLADDFPCSQNLVIEEAARLLGMAPPALVPLDDPTLSPMARAFYGENRRVSNGKAKRLLGWKPLYPTYRQGLAACHQEGSVFLGYLGN
jgi:nucleoside-diphosphate-sugar epimerase